MIIFLLLLYNIYIIHKNYSFLSQDADFVGFPAGAVALIARGELLDCNMTTKIANTAKFNGICDVWCVVRVVCCVVCVSVFSLLLFPPSFLSSLFYVCVCL